MVAQTSLDLGRHNPTNSGGAGDRILRLFARFVSVGYVFFLVVQYPIIRSEAAYLAPWWTPSAVTLIFGPAILLGATTFRLRTWTRRAAALTATTYLLAACTWPLAWSGEQLAELNTWIATIPGLAALAAALAWRPRWAVLFLITAVTVVQIINHFARVPSSNSPFLPDLIAAIGFCSLFLGASLMGMHTARVLDDTWAQDHVEAAATATAQARADERRHFTDLLHDWVMSTLVAAARQPHSESLKRQAQITLAKLDAVGGEYTFATSLGTTDLVAYLRESASEVDEAFPFVVAIGSDAGQVRVPVDAAVAVGGGLAEAMRNSLRHAREASDRLVQITLMLRGFHVVIADNGTGFDRDAVDGDRFGLSGIYTRMQSLPGGAADVDSHPARGTTVTLSWAAPEATPKSTDIRELTGLTTSTAWVMTSVFLVGITLLAATSLDGVPVTWPVIVAVAFVAAATLGLLAIPGDPLPWFPALSILAAGPVAFAFVLAVVPVPITSGAQLWPPFAATAMYTFLCVRGRTWCAWSGLCLTIAVCVVWATQTGQGAGYAFAMTIGYVGPVAMGTFFAYTIRPNTKQIFALRDASTRRSAHEAAAAAAAEERHVQLRELDHRARPMLERIAAADELTADERLECGVLEAHLRSTLRGRGLVHTLVDAAAEAARTRGVDVVLFDDTGMDDTDLETRERFLRAVAIEIAATHTGTIAIRLLPPHGRHLATVVARTDSGVRRVAFDRAGRPHLHSSAVAIAP